MTVETARPTRRPLDPARRRAWLAALAAALVLLCWQVVDFTYVSLRTNPARYAATPPGTAVAGKYGELRLLSWQQTPKWGSGASPTSGLADDGTVWVVAQLELTLRSHDDDFGCAFVLAATDGQRWSSTLSTALDVAGDSCVPDEFELGRTYTFRQGFQVPRWEVTRLAGVAEDRYLLGRVPLMVPPS